MLDPLSEFASFDKVAAVQELLNKKHIRALARSRTGSTPAHVTTLLKKEHELPSALVDRGRAKMSALAPEGYPEFVPELRKLSYDMLSRVRDIGDRIEKTDASNIDKATLEEIERQLSTVEGGKSLVLKRLPVMYSGLKGELEKLRSGGRGE